MAVRIHALVAVPEVAVELSQLPELVGDVLPGVRDGAVGSNNYLVFVASLALHREKPAAGVLTLGLQTKGARLLEQLEGALPEVQAQDVALPGQQVVADREALHGGQVTVHDARSDVSGQPGGLAASRLDGVEGLGLQLASRRVLGVEVADPGVQVPAVVVELPSDALDLRQA